MRRSWTKSQNSKTRLASVNLKRFAPLALVTVAFGWGASFVLMKDSIETQPILDFLGTRFLIATAVMVLAKPSVLRAIDGKLLRDGAILGLLLGGGYWTQTVGLQMTTAAITGFLTGLYVVITPLLTWLLFRHKIGPKVLVGVVLATGALAFISFNGFSVEGGQIWVIVCAALFAAHIVGLSVWSPGRDAYALTVVQLGTMAAMFCVTALFDGYQGPVGVSGWFTVVFTAVVGTAIAFLVQTWAQGIMDASKVAIYLTSEVVWAATIAVAVGQETLSTRTILGGALMLVAMLVVEWPSRRKTDEPAVLPYEPMQH